MPIEVLTSPVVDRRRPGIGVASGNLDIAERDPCVESRHDERGPEHVGLDDPEAGPLSDRADPAVSRPTVEAIAVLASQNRSMRALSDGQVEGPSRSRNEGHHRRLVAFAEDPEGAMPVINAMSSTLVPHASLTRSPFNPRRTASAAWSRSKRSAV